MQGTGSQLVIRDGRGASDAPALVRIRRTVVTSTHHFLRPGDLEKIEARMATDYLPSVTVLVAERDTIPLGFAGIADDRLEMLFVSDTAHGRGVGSALLGEAVARFGVTHVDVNEQNETARRFYRRRGFVAVGRSASDAEGRPYPMLHLELTVEPPRR
ncbi:GNAT family N-acetyltransferase [Pseudoclavibacter chungangensis]|uniref:GNAT family N-acetyltransferase n=1 Tax=Pseudoclavibacter chungangensis TaxID=587635 RepID=A0A7J5BM19_9MICO|nr:GNAT family N-acetyltransferase [Pseudoclavibacter chungangensis]KAB1652092.1 GNAT family N-acetyltransferase [Pseudoclavibacter chungangensis]NYJ65982.1 putative acetyltransferase [Pseudoclavibacter chungangensis]